MRFRALLFLLPLAQLTAQMIPVGQPIPRTGKPPVVFLNGYQIDCSSESFAGSFGIGDQILQANGEASVFFDNCTVAGKPSIERLAAAFSDFLAALRYTDGSPVDTVDIVAHSMGGLVVRCYLSGKQEQVSTFTPPATVRIRKALFLATPHFGSPISVLFGVDAQTKEMASGSRFLYDLGTWNQQTDDLRGVDALMVAGNGGTGVITQNPGFDDGVVALTSASLGFYLLNRTRVLPYCHIAGGSLGSTVGICPSTAKGIAIFTSADQDTARLMVSFLNGNTDWQSIGTAAEQNKFLSVDGGLITAAGDSNGVIVNSSATNASGPASVDLKSLDGQIAFTDLFPAGTTKVTTTVASGSQSRTLTLKPTVYQTVLTKPGPNVFRVAPAAAAILPLVVTPRMIVSIYGEALARDTLLANVQPPPVLLSDVQISVNGAQAGLLYVSPGQINAVLPDSAGTGLIQLTLRNSTGSHTVNLWVEGQYPVVFTQDQSGTGAASVLNSNGQANVDAGHPLHAGDYAEIFLTGLGIITTQPSVTVGGVACPVTYAGPAPGYAGLDQINCKIPSGVTAGNAALVIQAGTRINNPVSVAVQ